MKSAWVELVGPSSVYIDVRTLAVARHHCIGLQAKTTKHTQRYTIPHSETDREKKAMASMRRLARTIQTCLNSTIASRKTLAPPPNHLYHHGTSSHSLCICSSWYIWFCLELAFNLWIAVVLILHGLLYNFAYSLAFSFMQFSIEVDRPPLQVLYFNC